MENTKCSKPPTSIYICNMFMENTFSVAFDSHKRVECLCERWWYQQCPTITVVDFEQQTCVHAYCRYVRVYVYKCIAYYWYGFRYSIELPKWNVSLRFLLELSCLPWFSRFLFSQIFLYTNVGICQDAGNRPTHWMVHATQEPFLGCQHLISVGSYQLVPGLEKLLVLVRSWIVTLLHSRYDTIHAP